MLFVVRNTWQTNKQKGLGWRIQGEINLFQPDLVGWLAMSDYGGNSTHSGGFCSSGPSNTLMLSASRSRISLCSSSSSERLPLYRTTSRALTGAGGDVVVVVVHGFKASLLPWPESKWKLSVLPQCHSNLNWACGQRSTHSLQQFVQRKRSKSSWICNNIRKLPLMTLNKQWNKTRVTWK